MCLNNENLKEYNRIFINGQIYSINEHNSVYEAMKIRDGVIVALGSNEEIVKLVDSETEIINLKYKTIIPGFIDAHCYIPELLIMKKDELCLCNGHSVDEYLKLIQQYIDNHPEKRIIYGVGWKYEIFKEEKNIKNEYTQVFNIPKTEWIQKIKTDKPIVLKEYSNQALWLNKKALEYFNITKDRNIPVSGCIELDENGDILGILKGNAMSLVQLDECEQYKDIDYINGILKYQNKLHSYGITSIGLIGEDTVPIPMEIYRRLEIMNKLKLRISYGVNVLPCGVCKKTIYEQIHELKRKRIIYKTNLFDVSIAQFVVDGTIQMAMSYLFKPYTQITKKAYLNNGDFLWDLIELEEGVKMANRLDFNVSISARGDNACKLAMDAIEYSIKNNDNNNYRNALIHLDLITKYYIRRMKLLNINAVIQPFWFYKSNEARKCEVLAIGEDRAYRLYPFKSLIDEKIITASSSEYYVDDNPNPLDAIRCATCRNLYGFSKDLYGTKIYMNDSKYKLNPDEKVNIMDVLKSFTIDSAYILGREKEIGSLEIGKKADFLVLNKNIFEENTLNISSVKVNRTYFNGELVYLYE